jgi:GTP-binding protein EngB required for normal cell division
MPEQDENTAMTRRAGELNEHQQRRLRVTCEYVDKLLADIDDILHAAISQSPFPRFIVDVSPAQVRVLEDYIRRIRSQLVHTIAWQKMRPEPPNIPATRAVATNLSFIDIAIEELRPKYMRGFGQVPEDAVAELNGVVHELRSLVDGMQGYLKQELGTNLEKRLEQLQSTGYDVVLLRLLEQIASRNGLVEFRTRIDAITARLEEDSFEVALFGRVSSGKSSLLNALLGTNVLPVGITPITAVPTKIRYGATLRAAVSYGDGRSGSVSLDEFRRIITEQGNPGNIQNIVRALLEVPSPRLKEGILLVDTPGLGSLAKRGAAETLAYLPSCDLALLLVDAGATLNEEDIDTLRLLYEAGIPALVLLSKSDVLAPGDLHQTVAYIEQQVKRELSLKVVVYTVSALPNYSVMLDHFYERELVPRFQEARTLREASVARKIGVLREAVTSVLETFLNRERRSPSIRQGTDLSELESTLRVIAGEVGEQRTVLDHAFREIGERPPLVLDRVAERAVLWVRDASVNQIPSLQLAEWIHEVIWALVQSPVEELRHVGERAIANLQRIANEMGRTDAPAKKDFELLLRDMPRFELAALPSPVRVSHWKFLGEAIVRSRIKTSLRESIGSLMKDELHQYGLALSQWSEQVVRKLEALVNSYADAYRMQIHRIGGTSGTAINVAQAEQDLALLANWESTRNSELAEKGA